VAKDSDQIVVGANGENYTAPEGTPLPANEGSSLNGAFVEVGYADENGVTLTDTATIADVKVWQSFYPARRIVTDRVFTTGFNLRQWSKGTVELAFGGTVSDLGGGHFKLSPPAPEHLDIRALIVDWHDGAKNYRLVVPKCIQTASVNTKIARAAAADLAVTLSVLAEEGDNEPWHILTNDAAFSS